MGIRNFLKPKKIIWSTLVLVSLISIAQESDEDIPIIQPGSEFLTAIDDEEAPDFTTEDVPAFGNESVGLPEEQPEQQAELESNEDPEKKDDLADFENVEPIEITSETESPNDFSGNSGYIIDESQASGEVSVERTKDFTLPYKERRTKHGVLFSVFSEKFYPSEYFSLLDDRTKYGIMNGDQEVDLIGAEIGYKFNFAAGSLAALFNYSQGLAAGAAGADLRDFSFVRMGASANFAADNFFREPWIVPYGQLGIHQFSVEEISLKSSGTEEVGTVTTGYSLNYKVGMLFQLNWIENGIDSSTHREGLRSSGLENTFLDVYMSWHQPSQNLFDPNNPIGTADLDPDLSSEAMIGVGLKLEF